MSNKKSATFNMRMEPQKKKQMEEFFQELGLTKETAIGYVPEVDDINLDGLDFSKEALAGILNVDKDLWKAEVPGIKEFYAKFGDKLPAKLQEQLDTLEAKLAE